ncbi:MAG: hypothetical protein LBR74_06205, partial [Eubacterium sp.]|nr:hypothetical protein [Eubacterium sp.]
KGCPFDKISIRYRELPGTVFFEKLNPGVNGGKLVHDALARAQVNRADSRDFLTVIGSALIS